MNNLRSGRLYLLALALIASAIVLPACGGNVTPEIINTAPAPTVEPSPDIQPTPTLTVEQPDQPPALDYSKFAAWRVGSSLGLAAALRIQGGVEDQAIPFFEDARVIAEALGLGQLNFPDAVGDFATDGAAMLRYILDDEDEIALQLSQTYGEEHSQLYTLGVKSALVAVLYNTEDISLNDSLIAGIESAGNASGLPKELWTPLLTEMRQLSPYEAVKQEMFETHRRIGQYLAPKE